MTEGKKKLASKLIGGMLILFSLIIAGLLCAFLLVNQLNHQAATLYSVRLRATDNLIEADRDAYQARIALLELIHQFRQQGFFKEAFIKSKQEVLENTQQTYERFTHFRDILPEKNLINKQKITAFYTQFSQWKQSALKILTAVEENNIQQAFNFYNSEFYQESFSIMRNSMDFLTIEILKYAENDFKQFKKDSLMIVIVFVTMIALIIICLLGLLLILNIILLRPLKLTIDKLKELSTGSGDLSRNLPVITKDEIGNLAIYFNAFTQNIQQIILGIKKSSAETIRIKEQLGASLEETSAALEQVAHTSSAIKERISHLNQDISFSKDSLDNIQASVGELDSEAEKQAAMVQEASASITQMISSIKSMSSITAKKQKSTEELQQTAEIGNQRLEQTDLSVRKITEYIDKIKDMVKVISSIAGQTNLLAMNAAIEAAHAGDAGRGFSVVADEIRKLAENSTTQSKQISHNIKEILGEIQDAADSSQLTKNAFTQIYEEIKETILAFSEINSNASEMDQGGQQILEAMGLLQEASVNVTESSAKMRLDLQSISEKQNAVLEISNELESSITEIASGNTEIMNAMDYVDSLNQNLDLVIHGLGADVARFIITEVNSSE